jgi:hypothetical protein
MLHQMSLNALCTCLLNLCKSELTNVDIYIHKHVSSSTKTQGIGRFAPILCILLQPFSGFYNFLACFCGISRRLSILHKSEIIPRKKRVRKIFHGICSSSYFSNLNIVSNIRASSSTGNQILKASTQNVSLHVPLHFLFWILNYSHRRH